jgi:SAM-dependent methyltransferase
MNAYTSLARFYDTLTRDVPYISIADYYEALFKQKGVKVRTILDMACGTGTLTCVLADRGFDMIGVDMSEEMLSVAAGKAYGKSNRPLLLNQPLELLDLYGTVDAAVCALDGMNYIKPDKLAEVFRRVRLFLEPGGMFIFDINTPSKLKGLDGEVFLDETDDVFCIWRVSFDQKENACHYGMDIFARDGKKWTRGREEHIEYVYEPLILEKLLLDAGFEQIVIYGDMTFDAPRANDQRVFITAIKPIGGYNG